MKKIILHSLLCLFVAVVGYFSYKFYFEELIQEYFKSQVMKRMEQNLANHEDDFDKIVELSRDIKELRGFELYENDVISLRISNYNSVKTLETEYIQLLERNDSVFYDKGYYGGEVFIESIEFLKDSSVVLNTNGFIKTEKFANWEINYKGNFDNLILKEIFNYQKVDFIKFVSLKQKLEKVNCNTYWKRDEHISLTYAGRYPSDCFVYDIYNKEPNNEKYVLDKNYFCRYQLPSICLINVTNWYGEGKVD